MQNLIDNIHAALVRATYVLEMFIGTMVKWLGIFLAGSTLFKIAASNLQYLGIRSVGGMLASADGWIGVVQLIGANLVGVLVYWALAWMLRGGWYYIPRLYKWLEV